MSTPLVVTARDYSTSRYESLVDSSSTNLNTILRRAEQIISGKIGMALELKTYTDLAVATGNTLFLTKRPVVAVTSVSRRNLFYGDTFVALSADTYRSELEAGLIIVRDDVIVKGYETEVVYTAGYTPSTLPEPLKEAVLLQAARLMYQDFEIYGAGDSKEPGLRHFREEIEEYIAPFRRSTLVTL